MEPIFKEYFVETRDGTKIFTYVILPDASRTYPVVVQRSPYVDAEKQETADFAKQKTATYANWLESGYAIVVQHCRGTGRSEGDCIPYHNERNDGLDLLEWIRKQPFYGGELYLFGASYLASVHFLHMDNNPTDVKGAVLTVQDCYRYNIVYRNGFLKVGLYASWYVGMYKKNSISNKSYTIDSFRTLPLADFGRIVFGEQAYDFDETLQHPDESDPFWKTPLGGSDSYNALNHTTFPVLLITGLYDIYAQGVFEMWERMPAARRSNCALLVHPYDHGETFEESRTPVYFENGELSKVAPQYALKWFGICPGKYGQPLCDVRESLGSL